MWLGASIELDTYTWRADALRQAPATVRFLSCEPLLGPLPSLDLAGIGWLIAGGESGPGHRPVRADWLRELRDRCTAAEVPFLLQAMGRAHPQGRRPTARRPHLGPVPGPGPGVPRSPAQERGRDPPRGAARPQRGRRRVL